jgi:arylsulfatase A-like enzyme
MRLRTGILPSLGALAAALIAVMGCSGDPKPAPPNIILVSIDSLRASSLGCYGYKRETSPFIDELAEKGVRFENAISTSSWTLPAHAALFTGLYDSTHGLVDNGQRLADGLVTLAEVLRARGYHTAGFFSGPYLHPTFGLARGFDVYESCMTTTPDEASEEEIRGGAQLVAGPSHRDVTGPRTLEKVSRWADRDLEEPFFLFVHLWDVHYDYMRSDRRGLHRESAARAGHAAARPRAFDRAL